MTRSWKALVAAGAMASASSARAQDVLVGAEVRARAYLDRDNAAYQMDPNGTSRFVAMYRGYGFDGFEIDGDDSSYGIDPSGFSAVHTLTREVGYAEPEFEFGTLFRVDPSGTTRLASLHVDDLRDLFSSEYGFTNGAMRVRELRGGFGGTRCSFSVAGACVQMFANGTNANGGGLLVSNDGGWVDFNDGWVAFAGSTGLDMDGRALHLRGGSICMGDDCRDRFPTATRNVPLHQRDKSNCGTGGGGVLTSNGDECCSYQTNCHTECSGWWGRGCWWGRGGSTRCDTRTECNSFRGWTRD